MARHPTVIEKIENQKKRKATFKKRRDGLVKKAYEIWVLSDSPVALITFSPDNELCQFSRSGRFEDILINYLSMPGTTIEDKDRLMTLLEKIKTDDELAAGQNLRINEEGTSHGKATEDHEDVERLKSMTNPLDALKEIMRILHHSPQTASKDALEYSQEMLIVMLQAVATKKENLLQAMQTNAQMLPTAFGPIQTPEMQQWYIENQQELVRQQQEYYHLHQQQQHRQDQRQQKHSYVSMPNYLPQPQQQHQQQRHPQHQLVSMPANMNSPIYQHHIPTSTYWQQQTSRTINQNKNMNMLFPRAESTQTMGGMSQLHAETPNMAMEQTMPPLRDQDIEGGQILRGGSSSAPFCYTENLPLHTPEVGLPNSQDVQD